jgi:hypothetical protein
MKMDMYETNANPSFDRLEQECETWDWARAAGVSAQDLRTALEESLSLAEAD